jgi:RNA polymerase sigma-70 factor (ECF subfamily)
MALRRARDTRDEAERAFEQLYRGYRADVHRAALRQLGNVHDAEDVTQAAFVDAYRAVLRGTRPQAPRAWLLTIAENVRRRRFRTSLRRPCERQLDADAALAAEESHEQAGALLEALATLTAEQREAFLLREVVGLSYEEIAERMGSTIASVQMLLFRARKTLRQELEPPQAQGAYLPLTWLFSRFDALSLTPRAAGAVGAAALAVGVGASVPEQVDPPAPGVEPEVATIAAAPNVVSTAPVRPAAARTAPAARTTPGAAASPATAAPGPEPTAVAPAGARPPATAEPQPAPEPEPDRETEHEPEREPTSAPQLEVATPPALPVASPAVSTPSVPPPPLELLEPVLEGAGAAGAAGADAPPLPELPLDPVPPIP